MLRLVPAFCLLTAFCTAAYSGSVSGIVVNDADRSPVRKAAVTITSIGQDRSFAVAITDGSGRFTLPDIPAGRYRLHATRNGYYTVSYGATKPQRQGTILDLASAEQRTAITLHLVPVHIVSGNVYDAEGDPLPGVQITLYSRLMDRGKPRYQQASGAGTNQQGHYELTGNILPGQYWAFAQSHSQPALRTHPVAITGETLPPETLAPQFYSHADRLSAATPIMVSPGSETPNIDFQLNYAPQLTVHGAVSGIPEQSRGVSIQVQPDSLALDQGFNNGMINIDPTHPNFHVAGLVPGPYRIVASAGNRRTVSHVQLSSTDTEVNVTLPPGTPLSGTVTVEGPAPASGKPNEFRVALFPGDGLPSFAPVQTSVKAGAFSFPEVAAGIWDINVTPLPPGAYIKSMRLGKQDVLLEEMDIGPNSKGPLAIVISTAAPKVEGTLTTPASAIVLAAPIGNLAKVFSFYSTTRTDEKGHFKFEGLNPGAYRFYAFQDLEQGAWQDTAFLTPFETQSKPLDLKEGATETLTLTVIGSASQ